MRFETRMTKGYLLDDAFNRIYLSYHITIYPSLEVEDSPAAHIGGCMALALDPRGKY